MTEASYLGPYPKTEAVPHPYSLQFGPEPPAYCVTSGRLLTHEQSGGQ